ncbi:MAG: DUF5110 domain-containing protein, partial [Bacteroidia bacterium]|nr:DUF5110 domain-containing protein [Bacteroidia bacterium]
AIAQPYEYMFGKSFLVAPITEPDITEWNVYLPKSTVWYDFWTGKRFNGGQTIKTAAPQDKIPLFVKAGSIVPMGPFMQYSSEKPMDTLEIRIYSGADGEFTLYSDEGDNYNYEKGKYSVVPIKWNEQYQTLTIEKQQGAYEGALKKRLLNIVWVNENDGKGSDIAPQRNTIIYSGNKMSITRK